jgi:SAM-dependent methyltransferase
VVDGVPVLLVEEEQQTHASCTHSLDQARGAAPHAKPASDFTVDPVVQDVVGATCGTLYQHLVGRLTEYPIPELRLPSGGGRLFLEVGCNWGRWCIAAARAGYRPVGIDPSLDAVLAARRVARQLGVDVEYLVGDARHLPFAEDTFEVAFSYSVFQHFTRDVARASIAEIGRVLQPGGVSLVQMPNVVGARNLLVQARRRRLREPTSLFDVRYWTPSELERDFSARIGPTSLSVDGFFSLNVQPSDAHFLPLRYRALVRVSEALRAVSRRLPVLRYVADSLYVHSTKAM